jgi:hypothetical protein
MRRHRRHGGRAGEEPRLDAIEGGVFGQRQSDGHHAGVCVILRGFDRFPFASVGGYLFHDDPIHARLRPEERDGLFFQRGAEGGVVVGGRVLGAGGKVGGQQDKCEDGGGKPVQKVRHNSLAWMLTGRGWRQGGSRARFFAGRFSEVEYRGKMCERRSRRGEEPLRQEAA